MCVTVSHNHATEQVDCYFDRGISSRSGDFFEDFIALVPVIKKSNMETNLFILCRTIVRLIIGSDIFNIEVHGVCCNIQNCAEPATAKSEID